MVSLEEIDKLLKSHSAIKILPIKKQRGVAFENSFERRRRFEINGQTFIITWYCNYMQVSIDDKAFLTQATNIKINRNWPNGYTNLVFSIRNSSIFLIPLERNI